jgi:hypothetical protein
MKFEPPYEKYLGKFFTTRRMSGQDTAVFMPSQQKIEFQKKYDHKTGGHYESAYVNVIVYMFNSPENLMFLTYDFDFENENTNVGRPSEMMEMAWQESEGLSRKMIKTLFVGNWKEKM